MDALEAYLAELSANRLAGAVPETSGYGPLATLLNEVGRHLKPKVRCVINPANRGAGIPDGGFFIASQFQKGAAEPLAGQLPARGALEVKPVEADVRVVAESEQVRRYLEKYRQVLVTSYREFVLVGYDADGERAPPRELLAGRDRGRLLDAGDACRARRPASMASASASSCSAACCARRRSPHRRTSPGSSPPTRARPGPAPRSTTSRPWPRRAAALEEALGMEFTGEKGEHFFRCTLVQTLFYGLFAAWVFWAEHHEHADATARFDWRTAAALPAHPHPAEALLRLRQPGPARRPAPRRGARLGRRGAQPRRPRQLLRALRADHAVQYFYEPFLEAFDPELRKELGVWYTPPEIVTYMVERVDQVLRRSSTSPTASPTRASSCSTPAAAPAPTSSRCWTGSRARLRERGDDALLAHDLKEAAKSRVFGFEILPAPFVISHLQIGMLLHRLGAPLSDEDGERAGVYLTNALTGWEPPTEPKQHLLFTEMEEERDKAEAVKQHAPILVILGNPPYNGFAGSGRWTRSATSSSAYRTRSRRLRLPRAKA